MAGGYHDKSVLFAPWYYDVPLNRKLFKILINHHFAKSRNGGKHNRELVTSIMVNSFNNEDFSDSWSELGPQSVLCTSKLGNFIQ
jgi:hypothetical protein